MTEASWESCDGFKGFDVTCAVFAWLAGASLTGLETGGRVAVSPVNMLTTVSSGIRISAGHRL